MPKIYKNIPVSPEVYQKVTQIAASNFRTLGGQVTAWVMECSHPAGQRTMLGNIVVIYPGSQTTVPVQIWQCQDCGRMLILPAEGQDVDHRPIVSLAETEI